MVTMQYRTALNDLEFYAFHGLYPEEKLAGGKFSVDVLVEQDVDDKASMRRLTEVVNYEQLFAIVKKEMDKPRDLLETVARSILDEIGSRVKGLRSAEVSITKFNPGGLFKSGKARITLVQQF
jgi:dihydroneopterin aldolase